MDKSQEMKKHFEQALAKAESSYDEGNENVTGDTITDAIRVINASVNFEFDENNEDRLELNQTYTIFS